MLDEWAQARGKKMNKTPGPVAALRRFAAGIAAIGAAALPHEAPAHEKLGANLNFIGDFRRNHEFVDVVKQSRIFLKIGQFDDSQPANRAPIGTDGWPTSDFRVLAMVDQENVLNLGGTYKIVFNGQATLTTSGGGSGSIANQAYDSGTNTTTADLIFPSGGANLMVDFTGTGGSVKNVRILRPGYAASGTPLLHTPWKDHAKRFSILRFMDWTRTNGNRHVNWSDRTTPEKLRTEAYIAQWETVIDAANALNRDPWINVPVQASDDYVTNLATLFRDRLNANLNVYVEYGNELWNFNIYDQGMDDFNGGASFNGATVNRSLAAASPPGSPLRFEGETDATTLGFRRVGLRLKEISDIFKTVWGAAAINTRVRPVLAGQMANSFIVEEGLGVVDRGLNVRPNTVFYAISGAPYIYPSATPDEASDEVPGMTVQQILDGLAAGVTNAPGEDVYQYLSHAGLGAWYGLKVVAYEAGFDNFGANNIANKRLANLDPQIRAICRNLVNGWHGHGFDHLLWFNAGADTYDTQFGMWPLVEDMANQAAPKNQCMDDILAAALPSVTIGTPVTGGAIAGGNYRGSAAPNGAVTGTDGPFGFPGYVEYLLRADVEGTYNIVFTGSAPAGESFRLKLNNVTVAANATLPATTGTSAPIAVTLRRGLNAMRIERAVGASFSISSFTITLVGDGTPDVFSFSAQTGVTPASVVISGAATINGLTIAANVSVSGGEYSVGCNGTFTSAAGTITNGQTVCVRHTASPSLNTTTTTTLTIGGISASFSSTTSAAPANPARLFNISTRMQVLTGGDVMIAGFIIDGPASKRVVINVAGPHLANFGVANVLANPTLTLVRQSDNAVIGTNDNWQTQANPADVAAIQATGFQPNHQLEPALIATLAPGAYTAIVQGANNGTGVGLVGLFEVDRADVPLINISTRGQVRTDSDVMIAGFIIQGDSAKTVVVNVAGPHLANFGITNPLANPQLTLVRSSDNAILATNDNWQTQANPAHVALIQATGFQPNHQLEPAIIATLPPGAYTAIVSGVNNGTGVALVGVFAVP
jgi:hypothetical protein